MKTQFMLTRTLLSKAGHGNPIGLIYAATVINNIIALCLYLSGGEPLPLNEIPLWLKLWFSIPWIILFLDLIILIRKSKYQSTEDSHEK